MIYPDPDPDTPIPIGPTPIFPVKLTRTILRDTLTGRAGAPGGVHSSASGCCSPALVIVSGEHNPNNFSGYPDPGTPKPDAPTNPTRWPRLGGGKSPPPDPHGVFPRLLGLPAI